MSEAATTVKETPAAQRIREDTDQDVRSWLQGIAGDSAIKITIYRKLPTSYKGHDGLEGTLETVFELVDEEYIKERHGGGQYKLTVFHNPKGVWKYLTSRSCKIAGPPKLELLYDVEEESGNKGNGQIHDSGSARVLDTMERITQQAHARADRAAEEGTSGGFDLSAIQVLLDPIQRQLEAQQTANADLRDKLMEAMTQKPDTTVQDGLIGRMWDGESGRLETVRTNHDTELRTLRKSNDDQLERAEDRHRDAIKSCETAHEREIKAFERSNDAQSKALEVAHESRIDGLKAENKRLDRELVELKKEVGELRAKKDMSIADKAEELMTVKNALKIVSGDDGEEKEKWYERVIGAVTDNPEALGRIFGKVAGETPDKDAPAPPQQEAPDEAEDDEGAAESDASTGEGGPSMPRVGQPFKMPDGRIYVRQADNSIVPWKKPAEAESTESTESTESAPPPQNKPAIKKPDESEVIIAITFMEGAIRNNTAPAIFAASARNLIPPSILTYMREVGVDRFLNEVAHLDPSSPLATENGRKFARRVGKFLLEGVTE